MKVFDTAQIKEIDAYTIRHEPVASIDLMERAAKACAEWLEKEISRDAKFLVFTGPGNNGGDGWAIARLLVDRGFQHISVYHMIVGDAISADAGLNRQRLMEQGKAEINEIHHNSKLPEIEKSGIVIDALFGSGLSRPLSGLPASVVRHINAAGCRVIAVDIPSGLMGEDNTGNMPDHIICATDTLTFQFPKRSFFFQENERFTGRWHMLDIGLHPDAIGSTTTTFHYLEDQDVANKIKSRPRFSHKGTFGNALLIAGSYGMMGAAILASKACLRSGTGLLTAHVPKLGYPVIQGVVPETIFSIDRSDLYFSGISSIETFNAVGVGPGIGTGTETSRALEALFGNSDKPMVIDADALNIIARMKGMLDMLPEDTIITPHPREFDRIFGESSSGYGRNLLQTEMAEKYHIIIVLKGANTSVALPDGTCFFNSTGNPGMATAGSGDVLTGIILSLLAQGYEPADAATLGPFVHGLAGDLAAADFGYHALIASDIINYLGKAFLKLVTF
ncbi:MAG: NAD(P)H-hydrate dehydratase [Bacteroidales bacterium]|nr:NAD(P)H-hydrate dehydratase [Bacteroidales bacterium]